jgi:uncharacterized protein
MNVTLVLTHDCNLRCRYCYAGRKFRRAMTWDVARRAIDLGLADGAPWMDLGFFGGEPLLARPLMERALAHAREGAAARGTTVRPQVTTNGTLLTDDAARFLRAESFYVGLSIDGCREAHDATRPRRDGRSSFDAALAGLDRALAHGLRMEVIAVVDPANVRWLARSVAFLADRGVPRIAVNPNFQADWTEEARAELERQYELAAQDYAQRQRLGKPSWLNFIDGKIITRLKNGFSCRDRCGFGNREIAVAPSGNLYPCERLVGEDTDEAVRMGNVFDGVDRVKQERYRSEVGNTDPECAGCAVRSRCMNWCGCTNYTLTGAIHRTGDVVCWHERTAIRVADQTAAALYREASPAFLKRHYALEVIPCR